MDAVDVNAAMFFAALDALQAVAVQPEGKTAAAVDEPSPEQRIVNMIVPTLSVHDVLRLAQKIRTSLKDDSSSIGNQHSNVASTKRKRLEPQIVCDECGNRDQSHFVADDVHGDTICTGMDGQGCGNVVQDHALFDGNAYRCFEGEEDRSHHGPAPNRLLSAQHHFKTIISTEAATSASLRRVIDNVELNLSQMGRDERRTREGYKDQMILQAIRLIDHAGDGLNLHALVCARAKETFAKFRLARENVTKFEATVAACLVDAFRSTRTEMAVAERLTKERVDVSVLHPYACPHCLERYNATRGLQFHACSLAPSQVDWTERNSITKRQRLTV
ncbi:unnamed protein product [Aphanomyces euteiches]